MTTDRRDNDDPFGTGRLRAATLDAWRSSPTRLVEDSNAEDDLVTVGYRDRLFTELAVNAADAAAVSNSPARIAVWLDDRELHVANTGAPLSADGVRSLVALRASAKSDDTAAGVIGRYGVGFTATATVADHVEIRSTTGSIRFDRADTVAAVRDSGISLRDDASVPLLRLAWPVDTAPAAGFDTDVVLGLTPDVDAEALLSDIAAQAPDLLLSLESVESITLPDRSFRIERTEFDAAEEDAAQLGPDSSARRLRVFVDADGAERVYASWLEVTHTRDGVVNRWLAPQSDAAVAARPVRGVLYAPTATDIELGLPARIITSLPPTPDRRRLLPDVDIASAAAGYADLLRVVEPSDRLALLPASHRIAGLDDARLTEAVVDEVRDAPWLPAAEGSDLVPSRATLLVGLTDELADVLGDLFADLVHPDLSTSSSLVALERLGVTPIGLAALADRLVGVDRPASWWQRLYAALAPLVPTAREVEELAALPVPRADGRMNIGARGLSVVATSRPLRWIRTVDPDADHPLLERLGVQRLSVAKALADDGLRALVEDEEAVEDEDSTLLDEVVELLVADPAAAAPEWLSRMALPADGEWRSADELLLPDAPLLSVLVDDHPFGIVDDELVARVGADVLRRIGVGWGFTTVSDEFPTAPDHDLPDEELWWDGLADLPETLTAVRDLDLVDDERWPEALTLLARDESLESVLADRQGYTAWWLRHHAEIDGHALGWYRAPSESALAGVRDVLDHPYADSLAASLGGSDVESVADADTLLHNLADPARDVSAGAASTTYAAIVRACRRGIVEPMDLAVPERVRAVSGRAVTDAVVIDRPWHVQVVDADAMVVLAADGASLADDAALLADILDVPTSSEVLSAVVASEGEPSTAADTDAVLFTALTGRAVDGEVRVHDDLVVTVARDGGEGVDMSVNWWIDDRGITHLRRRARR
ncbi:sacsin N-terminal ATP-binding-like domain-containing protein [Gordonia jacobaea]|uniref:sacsin N-terminal ATP-binding-like domain-containing protein n=1 Tax=Gordonia jacobaea TaxID=122202 RepID=UPI003D7324B6